VIKVLVDRRTSTIIVGNSAVQGRGIEMRQSFTVSDSPVSLGGGRFALAKTSVTTAGRGKEGAIEIAIK